MENCIYVLYNKLSGRYESVMSFPSDSMCSHRLQNNVDFDEYEICRIGTISIETGVIIPCNPVRLIIKNSSQEKAPAEEIKD